MKTQGREEIKEAVLIATLTALATQAITWGFETAKAAVEKRRKAREEKKNVEKSAQKEDGDEGTSEG